VRPELTKARITWRTLKKLQKTELCPAECMAPKYANVCNHDDSVSGCIKKRTSERQGNNSHPILLLTVLTQNQIIPISDLHSGQTRLQNCRGPVMEQSHCCCGHVTSEIFHEGRAHACEGSTTADPRPAARQLHQLCSQPSCSHLHSLPVAKRAEQPTLKGTRTPLSHCFKPFQKVSVSHSND